jgi:predicted RNA binding protein YcfA (HicA-like mRNA interferase family)
MVKAGDMFKSLEHGKLFVVKSADSKIIILGTKDGSHSMFVNPNNMESVFVPFAEEEVKGKFK